MTDSGVVGFSITNPPEWEAVRKSRSATAPAPAPAPAPAANPPQTPKTNRADDVKAKARERATARRKGFGE